MFRGTHTVRVDEKGRIKVPAAFRELIAKKYSSEFYVTSVTGECARLYPIKEWAEIEEKLKSRGPSDRSVRKFLDRTNYYGRTMEMDPQGRLLIHPELREEADLIGDVSVMGYLHHLEVWNRGKFKTRIDSDGYSADDAQALADLGV